MSEEKQKSTIRGNTELVNLWVPLTVLPALNAHAKSLGISRSKLLLTGALRMMEQQTEGRPMQTAK